jgi:hypothetical protein
LYLVQQENPPVSGGEPLYGTSERDAVNRTAEPFIAASVLPAYRPPVLLPVGLIERDLAQGFFPEMHENGVYRDSIQPRRYSRVAAKSCEFAKDLNKCVLRQVLGFGNIVRHTQANRVNSRPVRTEQLGESLGVATLNPSDKTQV